MKRIIINFSIIISLFLGASSCRTERKEITGPASKVGPDSYILLDSVLPGLTPKPFAEGIISQKKRFEQYCSFSPDGKEFHYSVTDSAWIGSSMIRVKIGPSIVQEKMVLTESDYQSGQYIEPNGQKMFFTSILFSEGNWHADMYMADRQDGNWTNPRQLGAPVNSNLCEWHPTFTKSGIMYFASERNYDHDYADIYMIKPENGFYTDAKRIPFPVNTEENETDPLIAPDESYLIFAAKWENGFGELDLYITLKKEDGSWTTPKNMKELNTEGIELAPALSPDEKFLFFTRRQALSTPTPSKIYWVDASIVDKYKE